MFPVFPSYPYISFPFLSTEYKSLQQCSPSCAMSCSQGDRVRGPYGECQQCWRLLWGVIMELSYLTPAPCSHSDSSRKYDKKSDREKRKKRWGLPKGRWDYLLLVVNNHVFILFMFQIYVRWVCKNDIGCILSVTGQIRLLSSSTTWSGLTSWDIKRAVHISTKFAWL